MIMASAEHSPDPRRVVGITQARMASDRLPGKVLKQVLGRPLLAHHLERLKLCRRIDQVVLATTLNPEDAPLVAVGEAAGVPVFRGSAHDVLDRFARCAAVYDADVVVRFTADCPLIDPVLSDEVIGHFLARSPPLDVLGMDLAMFPRGFDTEVFGILPLIHAFETARNRFEREHVTRYFWSNQAHFAVATYDRGIAHGGVRLCVDEPADFALIKQVLEATSGDPLYGWRGYLDLLNAHPGWRRLNAEVRQKDH